MAGEAGARLHDPLIAPASARAAGVEQPVARERSSERNPGTLRLARVPDARVSLGNSGEERLRIGMEGWRLAVASGFGPGIVAAARSRNPRYVRPESTVNLPLGRMPCPVFESVSTSLRQTLAGEWIPVQTICGRTRFADRGRVVAEAEVAVLVLTGASLSPTDLEVPTVRRTAKGRGHPSVYVRGYGQGRVVYVGLGRFARAWTEPSLRRLLSKPSDRPAGQPSWASLPASAGRRRRRPAPAPSRARGRSWAESG